MWKLLLIIPTLFLIGYVELASAQLATCPLGSTVELDQKIYTWTDKVYVTIVAPCYNFDSNLVDMIGDSSPTQLVISTRGHELAGYRLIETGTDTGIFTGEVTLSGFCHDSDGKKTTGASNSDDTCPMGSDAFGITGTSNGGIAQGPTDGYLGAENDDEIQVAFKQTVDETVVGSALIRWNIGQVQWLEANYPASGTGVVRVIDPDMNLNPDAVDHFDINVWSDSDSGGIDLTVTETNEATGMFEGMVFFTTTDRSSINTLRVAEGDTITAEYADNTLPSPYTTADKLDVDAESLIQNSKGDLNSWTLDEIRGARLALANNDGVIVFPEDIDQYFPYNNSIKEKVEALANSGQFSMSNFHETGKAVYDQQNLVITKTSEIIISNHNEFLAIFGNDRNNSQSVEFIDGFGRTINRDSIKQMIQDKLNSCGSNTDGYCGKSIDELDNLIMEKTGKHYIVESLIINPIKSYSENDIIEDRPNVIPILTSKGNFLPMADAESGQFYQDENKYDLTFLNGFTIGYGFEKDFSYEFDVSGLKAIELNAHVENGLGIGLRIPIEMMVKVSTKADSDPNYVSLNVNHVVHTKDIDEKGYEMLQLPPLKRFGGKEFNMYLGPKMEVTIKILDQTIFNKSESPLPFSLLQKNDFAAPLGPKQNEVKITEYTIPCAVSKTCLDYNMVNIGLFLGAKGKLSGGEITATSRLNNPQSFEENLNFDAQDQEQGFLTGQLKNIPDIPYDFKINNVVYHSTLNIVPTISIKATFQPWIFSLSKDVALIELPGIEFPDAKFDSHEGVENTFTGGAVIPEFPQIALLIFATSVMAIIIISKKSGISNYVIGKSN